MPDRSTPTWLLAISMLEDHTDSDIARKTGLARTLIHAERRARKVVPHGRSLDGKRRCSRCKQVKMNIEFDLRKNAAKTYYMSVCRECHANRIRPKKVLTAEAKARSNAYHKASRRDQYQYPALRARMIIQDAGKEDRKKGRAFDLTPNFVQALIEQGCYYCGEQNGIMTMDRVDNAIGHTQENVQPACLRCNLTRGNMPYVAWVFVAKAMRQARENGLFGSWQPKRKNSK